VRAELEHRRGRIANAGQIGTHDVQPVADRGRFRTMGPAAQRKDPVTKAPTTRSQSTRIDRLKVADGPEGASSREITKAVHGQLRSRATDTVINRDHRAIQAGYFNVLKLAASDAISEARSVSDRRTPQSHACNNSSAAGALQPQVVEEVPESGRARPIARSARIGVYVSEPSV
jgi:hypothetical protein